MSTSDQFVMTGNLPPPLGHKIKNKNKLADSLRGKQPGLKSGETMSVKWHYWSQWLLLTAEDRGENKNATKKIE